MSTTKYLLLGGPYHGEALVLDTGRHVSELRNIVMPERGLGLSNDAVDDINAIPSPRDTFHKFTYEPKTYVYRCNNFIVYTWGIWRWSDADVMQLLYKNKIISGCVLS
jgi:hypothetical protein